MEFRYNFRNKEITFTLLASELELIKNLSFIHLVKMKFNGDEIKCGWFQYEGNDKYITIKLSFPDWDAVSNAEAHCNQFIDEDGTIVPSYRGALEKADPDHTMARSMEKRALSNRL